MATEEGVDAYFDARRKIFPEWGNNILSLAYRPEEEYDEDCYLTLDEMNAAMEKFRKK